MLQLTPQSRIFLAVQPVDFRKGIDGLRRTLSPDAAGESVGWRRLRLSQPHRHDPQTLGVRWPRFWLCTKRLSHGRFPLVADRYQSRA